MSSELNTVTLTVPADLTKRCKGLAIDMGGSVLKFVFRTKDDVEKATADESKYSRLHLVSFGRNSLQEGLEYVKKNAYLHIAEDKDEPLEIYTTGLGCTEFGKLINETLNVRLSNISEFSCFVKSFVYLAEHLPRSELLEQHEVRVFAESIHYAEKYAPMVNTLLPVNQHPNMAEVLQSIRSKTGRPAGDTVEPPSKEPLAEAESDLYPCILVTCGSGLAFLKVEKDGTYRIADVSSRFGTAFMGIGKLLTGAKTFGELIDLASKGDQSNIDRFLSDYANNTRAADDDKSMYSNLANKDNATDFDAMLLCFAKVASDENDKEFRREDVARSWLNSFVIDLALTTQLVCALNDVKRVFFCGGFCASQLVRFYITQELERRNVWISISAKVPHTVTFDFIKPGQHLGALGCILNGVETVD